MNRRLQVELRRRLAPTLEEPLAFLPLAFGVAGFSMSSELWSRFGYGHAPQSLVCGLFLCLGVCGYGLRWTQRSDPSGWLYYTKLSSVLYLFLGFLLYREGSPTGAVLFLTQILVCRKESKVHCLFTKSRRIPTP